MCLIFCYPFSFIAYAESPDEQPRTVLEGIVADIVTRHPVAGVTVTVAEQSCVTNAKGHYSISGLAPATSVMEITGDSIIPRHLMVAHGNHTTLDITVKKSDFNNAMFWATANHDNHIMRWKTPPKWVVYTHVLDSDPPKVFPRKDRAYLIKIIRRELPKISKFFENMEVELFKGRPNDDPRWTGKTSATGYILCAPASIPGGYANWWTYSGYWVRCAKIRNDFATWPKVWRHEIGHALGMSHAYGNKQWLPLGDKDPNYRPTKLHDGVEKFTNWDKLWLRSVYSGSRPAGNTPPDRDPDDFIHGKDSIYTQPLRTEIQQKTEE